MNKDSNIVICRNIKLDREHKNVLDYTEQEMVELCYQNAVAQESNYSFIKHGVNEIEVNFTYQQCLQSNYMAFQNKDYSNKWFFAFIDDLEYRNDGTTRIKYTIDNFATWFDYWDPSSCLVLREHVNSDGIGEHTYPENLEHGGYIANYYDEIGGFDVEQCKVIVGTTWLPSNTPGLPSTQYYGGVFSGVYYMAMSYQNAKNFILAVDGLGRGDAIVTVFMAPNILCPGIEYTGTIHSKKNNDDGTTSAQDYTITWTLVPNNYGGVMILSDYNIQINNTLNGYTPKNNKLYCFPYNYLLVTNQVGANAEYHYEDFINNQPVFNIIGTLSPGCSIKLYPENYKKLADSVSNHPGFNDGLVGAKFPVCSWTNDSFTNWETQQSVNIKIAQIESAFKIGGMIMNSQAGEGNPASSYVGLFEQQAQHVSERYQHALVPPQASGSLNGGDVTFARNEQNFGYYKMSIKQEYARKIDEYFNKFGYQVNEIKLPNQTGRTYWNFVQIGSYEEIGYSNNLGSVPAFAMENINNIYRNGVTIWHSHDNLGNYNLDNSL